MRKHYVGDFGKSQNGMGGWSDFFDDPAGYLEESVQDWGKDLEAQAREYLAPIREQLPADVVSKLEAELKNAGYNAQEALKTMTKEQATKFLAEQASKKENQDAAINTSVAATAEQISNKIISIKDSAMKGTLLKDHPIFVGVAVGVPTIFFLKWLIGKKRTQVVYAKPNEA